MFTLPFLTYLVFNVFDSIHSSGVCGELWFQEVLSWAVEDVEPKSVLDVGCGVGGSSRFLQKKYAAKVTGLRYVAEMKLHGF